MDKLYNDTKKRLSLQGEIDTDMSDLEVSAKVIWNLHDTISIDQVISFTNVRFNIFWIKSSKACPTCTHINNVL